MGDRRRRQETTGFDDRGAEYYGYEDILRACNRRLRAHGDHISSRQHFNGLMTSIIAEQRARRQKRKALEIDAFVTEQFEHPDLLRPGEYPSPEELGFPPRPDEGALEDN